MAQRQPAGTADHPESYCNNVLIYQILGRIQQSLYSVCRYSGSRVEAQLETHVKFWLCCVSCEFVTALDEYLDTSTDIRKTLRSRSHLIPTQAVEL